MVARELKRICVYLHIMYTYTYVCACIYLYIHMHTFLTTFPVFFTIKCPFVTVCQWLIYQWCTILSSHKPHLTRKANYTCIVGKLIGGKQSIHVNWWRKQFLERIVYLISIFAGSFFMYLLLAHHTNSVLLKTSVLKTKCSPPLLFFFLSHQEQIIFLISQLLLTAGQQICEAGNLCAGGSRLSEAFFTHQQDLPWVGLHSMVSKKGVTASWPSTLGMLLILARLRWGWKFLGKCPSPNQARRSEGYLLKAHMQKGLPTKTEGTTLASPGAETSPDSNKKGGKDDPGRGMRHKVKVLPSMTEGPATDLESNSIRENPVKTINYNRTKQWSAVVFIV